MRSWCLLLALALWPAAPAGAQLSISAQANKTQVPLDDQVVLAVTITGIQSSLPDPQLPTLQNFSVYSSGRNQSISFVNGQISSSVIHTFVLIPRVVGTAIIPSITVSAGGATARTEPIVIQVVHQAEPAGQAPAVQAHPTQTPTPRPAVTSRQTARPSGSAAAAPDVFVTMELDKSKAFVNEQMTLSVQFHTAVSLLGNPQYVPPQLEGFLAEDMPPLRHYNETRNGRNYFVTEIKTALFPLRTGRLTIGTATVHCQVQQQTNVDPFSPDFFERFFSQGLMTAQTRTLSSQPLRLEVTALPDAGKPIDFSGAVGHFSLAAATDKSRTKVGDAVNLTLTIQGTGNLKAIAEPAMPSLPSWRVFDPVTSVNLQKKGDLVQGSKIIRTVLVPRVSGDLAIPPVSLSYFDPTRNDYVRLRTQPLTVSVAPGEPNAVPTIGYIAPSAASAQGIIRVNEDLAFLKVRPRRTMFTRCLEAIAAAGLIHILPFAFFLWALALNAYRGRLSANPQGARFRGALKAAAARIRQAHDAGDAQEAAALMAEALTGYLAGKLGEPTAGLTMRRAQELLQKRQPQASQESIELIRSVWEDLDLSRFAPAAAATQNAEAVETLSQKLLLLLEVLEKELKR